MRTHVEERGAYVRKQERRVILVILETRTELHHQRIFNHLSFSLHLSLFLLPIPFFSLPSFPPLNISFPFSLSLLSFSFSFTSSSYPSLTTPVPSITPRNLATAPPSLPGSPPPYSAPRSSGTLLPRPARYFRGPPWKCRGFGNSASSLKRHRLSCTIYRSRGSRGLVTPLPVGVGEGDLLWLLLPFGARV